MSAKHYVLLSRMVCGVLLFVGTMPKAIAKEVKAKDEAPICPIEQVIKEDDLKSSANKQQTTRKFYPSSKDEESPIQDEEDCQKSETPEADETSDESVGVPETSEPLSSASDENLDQLSSPVDPASSELSNPGALNPSQPSISNQDSHDTHLNFHLEFGSPSSGGDESFPLSDSPAPTEPEPLAPEPEVPSSPSDGVKRPTQFSPARSKSRDRKNRRFRSNKEERQKFKKLRKTNKNSKHKLRKRSHNTSDKALMRKMQRGNKPHRKIKSPTRQSPLKQKSTSLIRDKSYRDKLPLIHRKHKVQKLRVRKHQREFYPTHHPLLRKPTRRTHIRHSSPKRLPNTFRSRSQFQPRFRPQIRHFAPRLHRVYRRR